MSLRRTKLWLACLPFLGAPAWAGSIADVVRSGYAEVGDGRVYYEASGSGPQVVFLSGGNWMDLREWDNQFTPLSRFYQVIRFDARGSGKSDAPVASKSAADDLGALLDALKIKEAHLVGLSRTAGVAVDFALAQPGRVRSLVLLSPIVDGWLPSRAYAKREADLLEVLKKSGAKAFAKAVLDDPYRVTSGDRGQAKRLLRANADRLLVAQPKTSPGGDPPTIQRLDQVRVPTLVVLGEQDDPEILQLGHLMASRIPGARKEVLFGSGHSPNLERRRQLNKLLRGFLGEP
jgi:pimeloyl-ACP methyl ester carboxylesterase